MSTTESTAVDSLRQLADFIEANPEFAPAVDGTIMIVFADSAEKFARLVKTLGGERTKGGSGDYFYVAREFGGLSVEVCAQRDQVCERVEVGTETVEVPDPDAPKVTVERPIYEWECLPVLEGAS